MSKRSRFLLLSLLVLVVAGIFYLIGCKTAYGRIENAVPSTLAATAFEPPAAEVPEGGDCL